MKARLFTDVIDCTLLTEQLGDARAAQANCCGARKRMRAGHLGTAEQACARVATDLAKELRQRMAALRQVLAAAAPPPAANP
jgi:hypothetical protein